MKNMDKSRRLAALTAILALPMAAVSAERMSSEPIRLFVTPQASSFWHTAISSTVTVPVDYPAGASSASLTVTAPGYERIYESVPSGDFTFSLPEAADPQSENVYELALTFDNGVTRTARLGLVTGGKPGSFGSTRCLSPFGSRKWRGVTSRMVVPVPFGTRTLEIDGKEVLDGQYDAQGWFVLEALDVGEERTVALGTDEAAYETSLFGKAIGMLLFAR